MAELSSDQVIRRCHDLIYQVAYSFYDPPYILLFKLLVQLSPIAEHEFAKVLYVQPNDVKKWMGMLLVHRLVKRAMNKERLQVEDTQMVREKNHGFGEEHRERLTRVRDVAYYYLDYRDFANVVKYRLAMMRKSIDQRINSEVGQQSYICPACRTQYSAMDLPTLFSSYTNTFNCSLDDTEVVEQELPSDTGQEAMSRFNLATAPIRDALRAVEGVELPSLNIVAWIAKNVKVVKDEEEEDVEDKRVTVVIGEQGEEKRETQRAQNALPVWHTTSTVTGAAAMGLPPPRRSSLDVKPEVAVQEEDEGLLEAHYAALADTQPRLDEDRPDEEDEMEGVADETGEATPADVNGTDTHDQVIMVGGVAKALEDITEDDEAQMTTEEYQAYYEAMGM